jgi:hypothetical protein
MIRVLSISLFFIACSFKCIAQQNADSLAIRSIYNYSLESGKGYGWLRYLCKGIGGRLAGSPQAEKAVDYVYTIMDSIVPGNVYKQEVMVVNWKRGEIENCFDLNTDGSRRNEYSICALGNSVGTPVGGISAQVIELKNNDDLKSLSRKDIEGKIVFYNDHLDQKIINTFESYSNCGKIRWYGQRDAAPFGALATINRSLTHNTDDYCHTGSLVYYDSIPKIPGAAISTLDADALSKAIKKDPELKLHFELSCKMLDDVPSSNVIGEIKGSMYPEEIIVVGGHLDAWDNGEGAHDDGAGCVQSIEVLNIFKQLGIQPKRTIRAVMFMNEENGVRGGKTYAEQALQNNENHIAAIESDAGGFSPRGFFMDGDSLLVEEVKQWAPLLEPYLIHDFSNKGSGADVSKLKDQGAVVMGLLPDTQRYFDYHHAESDIYENVNRRELQLGAATMAAMVYLLSEYGVGNKK